MTPILNWQRQEIDGRKVPTPPRKVLYISKISPIRLQTPDTKKPSTAKCLVLMKNLVGLSRLELETSTMSKLRWCGANTLFYKWKHPKPYQL